MPVNLIAAAVNRLRTRTRQEIDRRAYARWIRDTEPRRVAALDATLPPLDRCAHRPRISMLVPLYNTPERYLRDMVNSVRAQTYPNWELCLADDASPDPRARTLAAEWAAADPRLKLALRTTNGHISACSNSALALATGEYIALLDHDDTLAPRALERVVQTLNAHPAADLIYSDEDKVTVDGVRFEPIFKPDWNRWLFYAFNLVNHLGVYRKSIVDRIGGFREGYEGSQDYDLVLRYVEAVGERHIVHIPEVLYHWRAVPSSTAGDPSVKAYAFTAAKKAIAEHHARQGRHAVVGDSYLYILHKVYFPHAAAAHPVSIVLIGPSAAVATRAAAHVAAHTVYGDYELILGAPGAPAAPAPAIGGVRTAWLDTAGLSPAAAANAAAERAHGRHLVFLAPELVVRNPAWLDEMVSLASQPGVGAVGGKTYTARGRVRQAGYILGIGPAGMAPAWAGIPRNSFGRAGRARVIQALTAVSGDCLLTPRARFVQLGGFDTLNLRAHGHDIDYCLRVRAAGDDVLWTPFAEFTDPRPLPPPLPAADPDLAYLRATHADAFRADPAYSPNLNAQAADFTW